MFPPLPTTLTILRIHYQQLTSIRANQLPSSLTVLDLHGSYLLTTIEDNASPETLLELIILADCLSFHQLPSKLPPRLKVLNCNKTSLDQQHCASIVLPDTLRVLFVSHIDRLKFAHFTIPKLPDGLHELHMLDCHYNTRFPFHPQDSQLCRHSQ